VDENIGLIYFDIQRTQGTDGRVTVDMATQPGTAPCHLKRVDWKSLSTLTVSAEPSLPMADVSSPTLKLVNITTYTIPLAIFIVYVMFL
jgi:hypothetical protein